MELKKEIENMYFIEEFRVKNKRWVRAFTFSGITINKKYGILFDDTHTNKNDALIHFKGIKHFYPDHKFRLICKKTEVVTSICEESYEG